MTKMKTWHEFWGPIPRDERWWQTKWCGRNCYETFGAKAYKYKNGIWYCSVALAGFYTSRPFKNKGEAIAEAERILKSLSAAEFHAACGWPVLRKMRKTKQGGKIKSMKQRMRF